MQPRFLVGPIAFVAMIATLGAAAAFDETKYPNQNYFISAMAY
jgi:hypothetical protein